MPKANRLRMLLTDEVLGFLQQSNISKKNITRLTVIEQCGIDDVARLATVVREIAIAKPGKRKRWNFVRRGRPQLFQQALDVGLIDPEEDWDNSLGAEPFPGVDDCDARFDPFDRWNEFGRDGSGYQCEPADNSTANNDDTLQIPF